MLYLVFSYFNKSVQVSDIAGTEQKKSNILPEKVAGESSSEMLMGNGFQHTLPLVSASLVLPHFEQITTNAIVEGINNKLKLLKRSGFGFRNFNNFQLRALLLWHFSNNLAY